MQTLPTVIITSVVRSAHRGQSHGGVYLVDLESGDTVQKLDWADPSIDWEGRGGDRGLRGISFFDNTAFLAASDEIFMFNKNFEQVGSIKNTYLRHCHEITIDSRRRLLFMTSTGFDSVLSYDLDAMRFVAGYCLRFRPWWRYRRRMKLRPRPRVYLFDPNDPGGPTAGDTVHLNMVSVCGDSILVCGTGLGSVWEIQRDGMGRYGDLPYGTHNAQPWLGGILANDTASDRVALFDRAGRSLVQWRLPPVQVSHLEHADLPQDHARPAFTRGLVVVDHETLVVGSSPATVTALGLDPPQVLASVTLTRDVRNAVHGLELWPFSV
jgi:hypothetical protein